MAFPNPRGYQLVDGAFDYGEEGFEFTTSSSLGDTIRTRSSISSASTSPLASYFSLDAVSHQDLLADFNDFNGDLINHEPLGIEVHLESYAWSHSFMESFVILDYTITNRSDRVDSPALAGRSRIFLQGSGLMPPSTT